MNIVQIKRHFKTKTNKSKENKIVVFKLRSLIALSFDLSKYLKFVTLW